jgi:hypothetical protein
MRTVEVVNMTEWKCKAGSLPNGDVQDCGYPDCDCDPSMTAGKAIAARWKQDVIDTPEQLAAAIDGAIATAELNALQSADRFEAALTTIRDTLPLQNDEYARRVFAVAAEALEPEA